MVSSAYLDVKISIFSQICECDLQFAKGIAEAMKSFKQKNHKFYGFKSDKRKASVFWSSLTSFYLECVKRKGPGQLKCCRNISGPQSLYGPSKQCCPTGQVIGIGDTCDYSSYTYWLCIYSITSTKVNLNNCFSSGLRSLFLFFSLIVFLQELIWLGVCDLQTVWILESLWQPQGFSYVLC